MIKIPFAIPARTWPNTDLFDKLCSDPDWIAETKKDGWRCRIVTDDGKITALSKTGNKLSLPDSITSALTKLPPNSQFDAELQRGLGIIWIFDIFYLRGEPVFLKPLSTRRRKLETLFKKIHSEHLKIMPQEKVNKRELYQTAVERGDEGIVFKKLSAPYPTGETTNWIKCRLEHPSLRL